MTDLIAFFRARLDEDEHNARLHWNRDGVTSEKFYGTPYDPARVLQEIEAKRRIARAHDKHCEGRCEVAYPHAGLDAAYYWTIKVHAAVYDSHPDYRPEWAPDYHAAG